MRINKSKENFLFGSVIIYLFILLFLPNVRIGLPLIHFFILGLLGLFFLFFNVNSILLFFKLDKINSIFLCIILVNLFTYIYKSSNSPILEENFLRVTGNKPDSLYSKVALNGFFSLIILLFAYNFGKLIGKSYLYTKRFIQAIICFAFINSLVNIFQWFIQTGGMIGRYNFDPLLIPSQGASIGFSILGFLYLYSTNELELFKNKIIRNTLLSILAFSVIIIISRQAQISFIIILMLYKLFTLKKLSITTLVKLIGSLVVFVLALVFIYLQLDLSELFVNAANADSIDVIVRLESFNEATRIFYDNLILGVGYGMYSLYSQVQVYVAGELVFLASAHNGLASVFSEMGIVGVLLNGIFMIAIINEILKSRKMHRKNSSLLYKFINVILAYNIIGIISFFVSNYYLLPPSSEYIYMGITFIIWASIGVSKSSIEFKNSLNHKEEKEPN